MPDDPLHQPHDKLFRATFSDPRNAAAFLRHHLGGGAASCMDWASLALLPGSFINDQMKEFEADLLFSVKIGPSDALVYILWEHQRSEDPTMALRLLTYMVRIWEDQLKKQGQPARLAPILPVVLAQDKNRWKTSSQFQDLFTFPEAIEKTARACTPDFSFRLLQLAEMAYEDIHGTPESILTLRSLKAEPVGELLRSEVWDRDLITGVSREWVERFFRYVLNADVDRESFKARVLSQDSAVLTSAAMTLAEQFRQEGLQKGRQEGRQEGEIVSRRQALQDVLEARFGEVPAGLLEALTAVSDVQRLEKLLKYAAVCTDLEAFASAW
jgi:predicted transposase/invertase (TIGR01784 family)